MEQLSAKYKLLFIPFLIANILFLSLYTFLHWLLFIHQDVYPVKEEILNLWVPPILSIIVVLIWIRPRIKLLQLKRIKGSWEGLFLVLGIAAIAAPAMIAQSYMESATGKLTALTNVKDLSQKPPTKYYTLDSSFMDKHHVGSYRKSVVSGKYNRDLTFYLYLAVPVFSGEADTIQATTPAWIGSHYVKTISNRIGPAEKRAEENTFYSDSWAQFFSSDLHNFTYLRRVPVSYQLDAYLQAEVNTDKVYWDGPPVILEEIHTPFSERTGYTLHWTIAALVIGMGLWWLAVRARPFKPDPETLLYPELA